jgi:hypothetical protein
MDSGKGISAMRAAVDSKVFPLYEVYDGLDVTITRWPETDLDPEVYFEMQCRFRPLLADEASLAAVRGTIDLQWQTLLRRHEATNGTSAPTI